MRLFEYTPSPYVKTQVDLPLDFIYKQLETKQKEFDLQNAAIDKAAENFLKITPGMLTKDAYDRVKQQYLPQIEKIRDTLVNTGNVSMAAPELSKFTANLAADPEVKNIMEDYALTQRYNQALQEGKYTDKIFAGLYGPDGTPRAQLDPGEMTSAAYYSPMQFTDPVKSILPEAEKFKANVIEDIKTNPNKYGILQTDAVTVEQVADKEVRKYVNDRYSSWRQSPENQGYFWSTTNYKPQEYKAEKWDTDVAIPISNLLGYQKITKDRSFHNIPEITPPKPTKPGGDGGDGDQTKKKEVLSGLTTTLQGKTVGIPAIQKGVYAEDEIGSFDALINDKNYANNEVQVATNNIAQLTGIIPANTVTSNNWNNRKIVSDQIYNNYAKNEYGQWILKPGSNAPAITPEISDALTNFEEMRYASNTRENLINKIAADLNIKPNEFNAQIITDLRKNVEEELTSFKDAGGKPVSEEDIQKEMQKRLNDDKYKNTPEAKVYKAFNNLKNKMSKIQLADLPYDERFDNIEMTLLQNASQGGLKIKDLVTNKDASEGDGLTKFVKSIPRDDKGNFDTKASSLKIGYDPDDGVVGVFAFNGNYYQFDLSETNLDKLATDEYPILKAQMRFWQQISKSLQRSGNTKGSFNIGDKTFNFDATFKDLAKDNPTFRYEYSLDGVNTQYTNNLGDIFVEASNKVSSQLQELDYIKTLLIDQLNFDYQDKLNKQMVSFTNRKYRN
jgi:hypothetical protein